MTTEFQRNAFKHAIAAGKLQIGLWSSLCSNIAADIISDSGFDWLLLDTEHSPNEVPDLVEQLQAVRGGTATPIVRPAWNDTVLIKRVLDIGAQALLVALRAERRGGQARGRRDALSAARRARRLGGGARQPLRPHARLSRQGQFRDLRAGAGRDARGDERDSKPSPMSRASTAFSSARPISPPRSAISAIRRMRRCRRRSRMRSRA